MRINLLETGLTRSDFSHSWCLRFQKLLSNDQLFVRITWLLVFLMVNMVQADGFCTLIVKTSLDAIKFAGFG